jgi:hypothetical protein
VKHLGCLLWLGVLVACGLYCVREPAPGIVLEKYHYPAHVRTIPDVPNGSGMVWAEPGNPLAYEIAPLYHRVAEQWIIKVEAVNTFTKERRPVLVKVTFEVWMTNRVGAGFQGWMLGPAEDL